MEHTVALITGGARGLGRAIAEALLDKGLKVCIADVLKEVGEVTAEELTAKYGDDRIAFVVCDVTKQEQFNDAWTECTDIIGAPDLLINNAGIGDEKNWKKTLDVNLGGCITGTLLALEKLSTKEEGTGGRVVNIASIAAVKNYPFGPIYSATKSGIVGFSRALGHPLHFDLTGVKVQCLCPALVVTDFLQETMKTPFSPDVAKAMAKASGEFATLSVTEVATALVNLIEEGPNGGVMVLEPKKDPYYVEAAIV